MADQYDIVFIGHMCYDRIVPYRGPATLAPGSAVLCGAMAASQTDRRVAAVVKMAAEDEPITDPMKEAGVDVFLIPSAVTSRMRVEHPQPNPDVRTMVLERNAGFFRKDELPPFDARYVHLAGISDREFTLEFIQSLAAEGYRLSGDMQSFVRQVDPETGAVRMADVSDKTEIWGLLERVKLDAVEMKLLTGQEDFEKGAKMIAACGPREVIVTHNDGVLCYGDGRSCYSKFSNRSIVGRTGRGDTTFAAYLSWRLSNSIEDSLRFAAALVSLKMERPGPFRGKLDDVLERMNRQH